MKRLRLLFCLALLIVAGSALANPYGYAYFRTVTIDHTKVGIAGYAAYRTVTVDHTKVQATVNGYSYYRPVTIDHTKVSTQTSSGYSYYRAITFDHTKVGTVNNTDQTNFPVLLYGTFDGTTNALDVRTAANGGKVQNTTTLNGVTVPADLIFATDSTCATKLNWEIVSYSASSGAMEAWVKIPTLSHSADTTIYACYKNSSVSTYQGGATSTWDSNFTAVYHLNNNAANTTVTESTSHGYTSTNTSNTSSDSMAGQITNGLNYSGTDASKYTGGSPIGLAGLPNAQKVTMSLWINPASLAQSQIMLSEEDSSFSAYWQLTIDTNFASRLEMLQAGALCDTVSNALATGSWQYVTFVFDGSQSYGSRCKMYLNGASVSVSGNDSLGSTMPGGDYPFVISGQSFSSANRINAKIDEVRVSTTNRSADWIVTEYNNQNSPSTFLKSIGSETAGGVDLTNFPVLVSGTFAGASGALDVRTVANGGKIQNTTTLNGQTVPADLIFTSDAGCTTNLNWDIAYYVASSGAMEAWVKIPTLSHLSDTVIYACYGNSSMTTYQDSAASTWDSNYKGVWHLADNAASTTIADSTAQQNGGMVGGNTSAYSAAGYTAATSPLFRAFNFNGAANNATMGSAFASLTTDYTVESWIDYSGTNVGSGFYSNINSSGGSTGLTLTYQGGGAEVSLYSNGNYLSASAASGAWKHVVVNCIGGTRSVYVNGVQVATDSHGTSGGSGTLTLNTFFTNVTQGSYNETMYMSEFRVSNTGRSGDWIVTAYNNVTGSNFVTVGAEATGTLLSNFPVLIFGTYNGASGVFDARTAANGGQIQNTVTLNSQTVPADLIFTSDAACATKLNWEISSYTATTGVLEAWVQVPTLSTTADTVIYMCYNNLAVTTYQGNATSTWDSNYVGVWHLPNGMTLGANDSTSNANNGIITAATATTGQIDGGGSFNGSTAKIVASNSASLQTTNTITLEAWIKPSAAASVLGFSSNGNATGSYLMETSRTNANSVDLAMPNIGTLATTGANSIANGNWYHVVATRNGTGNTFAIYINGSSSITSVPNTNSFTSQATGVEFGERPGGTELWSGVIDEARISNIARDAGWIATEYNNQNLPDKANGAGGFYTIGSAVSLAVDETNFPVLVFCSACTYLKTGANGGQIQKTVTLNGQTVPVDLIFTSDAAGTTLLNWEVASYNASTGDTEVWVKIPTLSHTADTVIYMWYNNANIAATYLGSATSVWDANYKAIYHLPNGTILSGNDSTSNAFNAGFSSTPPTATTGQIDGGGNFVSGSSEYMSPGNDADMTTNDITLSGWINAPAANQFGAILSKKQVSGAFTGYTLGVGWYASNANMNNAQTIFCDFYDGGTFASTAHHQLYHTTSSVVDGNWHYVVCNRASGIVSIYVDGVSQALTADVAGITNVNVSNASSLISGFFDNNGSGSYYNGKEDELRVSNIARPVDWITTEYKNQKTPSTFETIGAQGIAQHHAKGFFE